MELCVSGSECSRNLPLDRGTRVILQLGQPRLIGRDGVSWPVLHRGDVAEQLARPRDVLAPACGTGELEGRLRRPAGFGWIAPDLHPSGAAGNASLGTAEKGRLTVEHQANGFIKLLRDVTRFSLDRLA